MINSFQKLIEIAKMLRGPEGCPWDKSRTLFSLDKEIMEEAEEVLEAIKNKDHENLREELGDLLFNIMLMCQIAEEENHFTMKDVLDDITKKIVSRHTWVFGDDKASTPEEALAIWKKNKESESKKEGSKK